MAPDSQGRLDTAGSDAAPGQDRDSELQEPERGRAANSGIAATFRVAVTAGIIGSLLWTALVVLGQVLPDQAFLGRSRADFGAVIPLVLVLFWLVLRGIHQAHRVAGTSGALERWSYQLATFGLWLDLLSRGLASWTARASPRASQDPSEGITLLQLVIALGVLLGRLGLLGFGIATLRARVLPVWGRGLPLVLGVLPVLSIAIGLGISGDSGLLGVVPNALEALAWGGLSLALGAARVVRPSPLAPRATAMRLSDVGAALFSRATLISGLVAVAAWSLEWNPLVGVLVVLLLYVHEMGHVAAAFWRGVRVQRAPFFLPGFGAFVETAPGSTAWDDVWISLGGPLVGAAGALAAKIIGQQTGQAALAHAGDFALLINLLNLAPFSPLDGGRVALKTGWFGLLMTLGLGGVLLSQGFDLMLAALVVFGGLQALAAVLRTGVGWRTNLGVLIVYLACIAILSLTAIASGRVEWLPSDRPAWMPSLGDLANVVFWIYLAGLFAIPYANRRHQSALVRYGILSLLGWPRYVLNRQLWMVPTTLGLLTQALGVGPGGAWVERYARSLARRGEPEAGRVAAHIFDALVRQGDSAAEARLWALSDTLRQAGPAVLQSTVEALVQQGYETTAARWLEDQGRDLLQPPQLDPKVANRIAWNLLHQDLPAAALPYARAAVAEAPAANALDTLGQVLLATGAFAEAESVLRQALAKQDRPGTRVALARALAALGRPADAVAEARQAVARHRGAWSDDEPEGEQVQAWIRDWQALAPAEPPAELLQATGTRAAGAGGLSTTCPVCRGAGGCPDCGRRDLTGDCRICRSSRRCPVCGRDRLPERAAPPIAGGGAAATAGGPSLTPAP
ncbi:MAG: hypothetical protein HYX52_07850 [Chloroflexi bacterium]|nr:hypothetical protein [Chloroflexota bacterium]